MALCIDRYGTKSQLAQPLLLHIWPSLFGLLPPALLEVSLLYEPSSFLDPLFLLAPSRFLHWYVGIQLALQSNGALVLVGYCLADLYTHVFGDRQPAQLRPHYLQASVVHKSTRVRHTPIYADFFMSKAHTIVFCRSAILLGHLTSLLQTRKQTASITLLHCFTKLISLAHSSIQPSRSVTRTRLGIEPATFRFVAQHLNHCATAGGIYIVNTMYKKGADCAACPAVAPNCDDGLCW